VLKMQRERITTSGNNSYGRKTPDSYLGAAGAAEIGLAEISLLFFLLNEFDVFGLAIVSSSRFYGFSRSLSSNGPVT
jgi:hypothetical protein